MKLSACIDLQAQRLIQAGVSFGHGTHNAFDEAIWLALWRLGLPLDTFDAVADQALSEDELHRVEQIITERIRSRKPAAYITREAWLHGLPFYVDERSIVPRSFIAELLVDGVIDPWLGPHTQRVLDLCTGNGSLAIMAALIYPDVLVHAVDLSPDALAVARINVDKHRLSSRVTLQISDVYQALSKAQPQGFDLILCNPPYVNETSMRALPAEYLAEPRMALGGGDDGMDLIRSIVAQAPDHLHEQGILVLEIGHEQAHFEAAFPGLDVVWLPCSAGDDLVLLLTRENLEHWLRRRQA